ncbi:MAG: hypothetical protein ACFFAE_08670 [Candidatus Hodarchaeota archaeon]
MGRSDLILGLVLVLSSFPFCDVLALETIATPPFSNMTSEIYDLRISQVLTVEETTFTRSIILSQVWDRILLNMTVQNFGDHLDNVYLKVTANGAPIQATFSAFEEVGLVQAISYQFEIPQTLVMTLNYSEQTRIQVEILILLDFGPTLGTPNIDFLIQGAQLIALNLVLPWERQTIPLYHANQQYQIQPVKYSFLKKNLLTSIVLFVHIPADIELECTVSVSLYGTKIISLSTDGQTFNPNESNFMINFSITRTKTSGDQDIPLTMAINPDYESLNGLTPILLSITVVGVLQPRSNPPFANVLGSHPIPGIIMFPILLISLFGVPYYLVYQEHVSGRDKNILDPQKQTKL